MLTCRYIFIISQYEDPRDEISFLYEIDSCALNHIRFHSDERVVLCLTKLMHYTQPSGREQDREQRGGWSPYHRRKADVPVLRPHSVVFLS
jgi:hypothetical protein